MLPRDKGTHTSMETEAYSISGKIQILQGGGKIPSGKIGFSPLKAVGTDCIRGDEDDFIQLDMKNFKN